MKVWCDTPSLCKTTQQSIYKLMPVFILCVLRSSKIQLDSPLKANNIAFPLKPETLFLRFALAFLPTTARAQCIWTWLLFVVFYYLNPTELTD